jgi:hypothetical protein
MKQLIPKKAKLKNQQLNQQPRLLHPNQLVRVKQHDVRHVERNNNQLIIVHPSNPSVPYLSFPHNYY